MTRFFELINQLINKKIPFYLYREPEKETIVFVISDKSKVSHLDSFFQFKESGFIFSPFINSGTDRDGLSLPILLIKESIRFEISENIISGRSESYEFFISEVESVIKSIENNNKDYSFLFPQIKDESFFVSDKEEYLKQCNFAINEIKRGVLKKMILSRIIKNDDNNIYNGINIFMSMENKYKNAFVFYVHIPEFITWIGASPELLANYTDKCFTTASLAGTKKPEAQWSEKEMDEQSIVTEYIINVLQKCGCNEIDILGPSNLLAGNIEHLFTKVSTCITNEQLKPIIDSLHPTPALCGTPKLNALRLINDIEKHSRLYYGGYLGVIDTKDKVEKYDNDIDLKLYVNLRSAFLSEHSSYLYVGGGITKDSDPEKEWAETIIKSETLLSVFGK